MPMNSKLTALLISDAKSGYPIEVIRAIEYSGYRAKFCTSYSLYNPPSADILIIDRCRSIVPQHIYNQYVLSFNCHPSLLPLHRGAHPILWAALFDDPVGVTLHTLTKTVDVGLHLFQKRILFSSDYTFEQVHAITRVVTLEAIKCILDQFRFSKLAPTECHSVNNWHHKNSYSNVVLSKLPLGWATQISAARVLLATDIESYRSQIAAST